jgi:membrane protease YdiL (CAAX protease family)
MVGVDLLRINASVVAAAAVVLSSLAFSMHHYEPFGSYRFDPVSFGFRAVAGAYLAIVFWYRGYGPAAGCHAAYNVIIGVWNA